MTPPRAVGALAAALLLSLACAGGDLTLPGPDGSDQPGMPQPSALIALSGDGQQAEPGAQLPEPLAVQVLDSVSRPVPGTPVVFGFADTVAGASVDPASALTDADGRASATVRLGDVPGELVIVAQVANTQLPDLRAQFSATAVPADGKGGGKKGGNGHGHGHEDD